MARMEPIPAEEGGNPRMSAERKAGTRGHTMSKNEQYQEGRARRDELCRLVKEGMLIQEACAAIGVSTSTYKKWRQRWPQFGHEVDAARGASPGKLGTAWNGGFAAFRKRFFKMDSPWFHLEVVDVLENAPPGSITLILLPPEHGKTTLLEDFCGYKLATDPAHRIGYASEKQAHSVKALARIKARMEDDSPLKEYVAHFGPFSPRTGEEKVKKGSQPWGATYFDVWKKGDHDERDYSLAALGIGAAVAGSRFDTLIIDDVQSLKSSNLSSKILETIRQDWLSRPGSKGRTVVIGTRVADKDVYQQMMEATRPNGDPFLHRVILHPAIDHNGRTLWPERYDEDEYRTMEGNVGPAAWARNYQQRPRAAGDITFTQDMIDSVKDPMRAWSHDPPKDAIGMLACLDPALGGQSSWIILAYNAEKLWIVDTHGETGLTRNEEIIGRGAQLIETWNGRNDVNVTTLIVEENTLQKGLLHDDRMQELQRAYGFAILGHQTGHNKQDPNIGVASMAMSFRRQEVVLPGSTDDATRNRFRPLEDELLNWLPYKRGNQLKMDRVMCLWFGWLWWRTRKASMTAPTVIKTQGLPWAATSRPSGLLVPTGMRVR